jgi:serine/threonine protein kinase
LEYLHRSGIAHRDIKGANVLVTNDGTIKVADCGASKRMNNQSSVGGVKGTPLWMAPEVIKEQQN